MNPNNKNNTLVNKFKIRFCTGKRKYKSNTINSENNLITQLIWITPALFFIFLFMFYAVFIIFKNATNSEFQFHMYYTFTLDNFKKVLQDRTFLIALRNSCLYVLFVLPVSLIISIGIAKALSDILNKRIFSFLQGLFFIPYVTSAIAVAMSFSFFFNSTDGGIMNQILRFFGFSAKNWNQDKKVGIWIVLIYGVWRSISFQIVMLTAAMLKVNPQYYYAASADGLPKWKQFWKITLPQITHMITYLITIVLITSFKALPLGLFASEADAEAADAQTIVFWIFEMTRGASKGIVSYQKAGSGALILMAIVLVITFISRIITKIIDRKFSSK